MAAKNILQIINELFSNWQKNPFYPWISISVGALLTILLLVIIFGKKSRKSIAAKPTQDSQKPAKVSSEEGDKKAEIVPNKHAQPSLIDEIKQESHDSWLKRLRGGLTKTRDFLDSNISLLFSGNKKLDAELLEELNEILFRSDMGVQTADFLVGDIQKNLGNMESVTWEDVKKQLKESITKILNNQSTIPKINLDSNRPSVLLIVGVNGVGKTTTIGKLAARFTANNKKVSLCAGDTFRAAAIEQLKMWGERSQSKVIAHKQGADPAAVAFDSVKSAIARADDLLIVDTAGRLHNKEDLMAELKKVRNILRKEIESAPHETWLIIDATTGQNAIQQVKAFNDLVQLTGLIVTKLDGTAKGGVIISICDQFNIPIRYIGVGEKATDLKEFNPDDFVESLF